MTPHERSREFYIRRHLFVDDLLTWGQLIWEGREGEGEGFFPSSASFVHTKRRLILIKHVP